MANRVQPAVLVLGLAKSGYAAATALLARGVQVIVTDLQISPLMRERARKLTALGAKVVLGEHPFHLLEQVNYIVTSPGVPDTAPIIMEAKRRRYPIISEPELAYRLHRGLYIAITGSNGKTTTATWVQEILSAAKIPAVLAGNIGQPLTAALATVSPSSWVVAELSSFQLQYTDEFHPRIGAILNLSEDHLDRHGNFDAYVAAKANIFARQKQQDILVLNADNKTCQDLATAASARIMFFSRKKILTAGAWVENGHIMLKWGSPSIPICPVHELGLPGEHNLENALATTCLTWAAGANSAAITNGLKTFSGLEHRCEQVAVIDGVNYINDSKGTNPNATLKAISAYAPPLILIAGGKDEGACLDVLLPVIKERCRAVILLGEVAGKFQQTLVKAGFTDVYRTETLPAAVQLAQQLARPGETVLLSPACASFDMFSNYEQRGQVFKQAVAGLGGAERWKGGRTF